VRLGELGAAPFEEPRQLGPEVLVALGRRRFVGVERTQELLEPVSGKLPAGWLGAGVAQMPGLQGRGL
jgi:hypothetical protein